MGPNRPAVLSRPGRFTKKTVENEKRSMKRSGVRNRIKAIFADSCMPLTSSKTITRLALGLLLLNLIAGALAVWSIYQSRLQYEERNEISTQNIAKLLEHDIAASVHRIDMAMLDLSDEIERQRTHGNGRIDAETFIRFIVRQHARHPDLSSASSCGSGRGGPGAAGGG